MGWQAWIPREAAISFATKARAIARRGGYRARFSAGQPRGARLAAERAVDIYRETGHRLGENHARGLRDRAGSLDVLSRTMHRTAGASA